MKIQMKLIFTVFLVITALTFVFLGCEKSVNENTSGGNTGYLSVRITDAPFPVDSVAEANVEIDKIEIRSKDTTESGNPFTTITEENRTYNLLTLRNGVTADLPEIEISVGEYDLVRLYVSDASIKLTDGQQFDLFVPSGAQTGIKMFVDPAIEIKGGLTSELILDFDLSKSFVVQGNPNTPAGINGFIFKPVIRAVNASTTGRIVGTVSDTASAVLPDAEIWIEQDSVITSTFTDDSGNYAFIGIPAGMYDVSATKTDYDTVTVADVEVTAANQTEVNFELTPQ